MALAIFDLDNTLIAGDSDHLWGEWLCGEGIVDAGAFAARNARFYADYCAGTLDIHAYLAFALAPLRGRTVTEVERWQQRFLADCITPIMLPAAQALLRRHRASGDTLLVITATNEVVTRPIARALGVEHLIGCGVEVVDGVYTGEPVGLPSYREGKVDRLRAWLEGRKETLADATFYSDSHNDLPLLKRVDHPVAVDPDPELAAQATASGWQIISLRS
ncbi:histidinol-phosphatase [Pseudohaliea rubra]|uniref:Histidinol-phosphatase n=1 Tax=Pseudohaliea rubra DSM 19751 TaxID=1265313 RepID=A0A095VSS3_9GAMM|nr:HAD family hydrolase [Pseudohaliea rubra]KGE04093.1 Phosphoserine phosphatase [Pseudohaliea rubra DSM 19751]